MNKKVVIKTILENKHVLILALITSIFYIIAFYYESMYQGMFQGYHTIYEHGYWISQVNYYSTMTVTMFGCGIGFLFSLCFFLTRDVVMPIIRGD